MHKAAGDRLNPGAAIILGGLNPPVDQMVCCSESEIKERPSLLTETGSK